MSTIRGTISVTSSADAQTFTFYDEFNNTVTLAADERIQIHTVTVSVTSGTHEITLFNDVDGDDAVDTGETLLVIALGSHQSFFGDYSSAPLYTLPGVDLVVLPSSSATYDVVITGVLGKKGT